MRCCGAGAASSSARPFIVFSSVPPLLCAFGSCTLNRTSWTTRDHLQETRQFGVGCPFSRRTPYFGRLACDIEDGQTRVPLSYTYDFFPRVFAFIDYAFPIHRLPRVFFAFVFLRSRLRNVIEPNRSHEVVSALTGASCSRLITFESRKPRGRQRRFAFIHVSFSLTLLPFAARYLSLFPGRSRKTGR